MLYFIVVKKLCDAILIARPFVPSSYDASSSSSSSSSCIWVYWRSFSRFFNGDSVGALKELESIKTEQSFILPITALLLHIHSLAKCSQLAAIR